MNQAQSKVTWLVYGENCMPINLLRRFGFNAPSTPYSSCRSNIEHATYFENMNYSNLLEPCQMLKVNGFSGSCYINTAKMSSTVSPMEGTDILNSRIMIPT